MRHTSRVRWVFMLALAAASLGTPATAAASSSGANGKIVFASDRDTGDGRFQIYSVNPDGSDVTRITNNAVSDRDPSVSPDGNQIAFTREFPGFGPRLYLMNSDGSSQAEVPGSHGTSGNITWTPDSQKVVLQESSIRIVDVTSGSSQTVASPFPGADPAMSPDGQKIAYTHGQWFVYTVNPDGSDQTFVPTSTNYSYPVEGFTWRPDSITLAFTVPSSGGLHDIYSVSDSAGDTLTRLTNEDPDPEGTYNRDADWSPDGQKIVYEGDGDIYSMDADGSNPTPITTGAADDREPSWQPVPPAVVEPGYPRPKGATPVQASLAIAYRNCFAPDREHGGPLSGPSCSGPVPASDYLTVGTLDSNGQPAKFVGLVTLYARPGDPDTFINDADVKLTATLTDVRCRATSGGCPDGPLSDYAGTLGATFDIRITDRFNTGPRPQPATVTDIPAATTPFRPGIPCAPTADTTIGSRCEVTTTFNAVLPSAIRELKRTIWEIGPIAVGDGGDDGNGATTDDNTPFATEGFFVP